MKRRISLLAALFLVFMAAQGVYAEQPLVQEGKKTVFQRVVSHPEAVIYEDEQGKVEKSKPRTFTSFYVYERKNDKMRVGVSSTKSDGWIFNDKVTEWPQAITMLFTKQMGRNPVLFFRDSKDLIDLCNSDGIGSVVEEYAILFKDPDAPKPADMPVIAAEPFGKQGQVAQNSFYLLPVLKMDDQFKEGGTQLLEVASIDPGVAEQKAKPGSKKADSVPASDGMKTGIVFLIDTTKSMGPYIDQMREVIRTIFDRLQKSPAKNNVEIAVVAFRSNEKLRPKTEYNTKVISDFVTVENRAKLEELLKKVEECKALTHAFDEDSLSGVKTAADLDWDGINSRAILLITDAGPLGAGDKTGATGMSPEGMADYLRNRNIYLTVAHVRTPAGKKDHAYAERSYKDLSMMSNNRSSYIPINAPSPVAGAAVFDKVAKRLAESYCEMAEKQIKGELVAKPENQDVNQDLSPEEQAARVSDMIGYSMQLQYAGDKNKARAPRVVKAWIADSDLASLEAHPDAAPVPVVEPAVLLTKSQLSQLRNQIKNIVDTAEESFLQDNANFNFYEQLISAAAKMSQDPSGFADDPEANLAQKGVLLEVLDGLPYKSQILRMKQEDWSNMSTGEQQAFIRRLKGLLREYDNYDSNNQFWESFGSKDPNEWVYRVPLKVLP